jgi:hypothetical protein
MSLQPTFHRLKQFLGRLWDNVLDALSVLWITRVSAISVAAGAVLFIAIPPVRDTLLEMRGDSPLSLPDLLRWAAFFVCAVLFWALPVHYAARRNVRHDSFFADSKERESERVTGSDWWGLWIPRFLGVACLAAIAVGAFMAQNALHVAPQGTSSMPLEAPVQQYDSVTDQTYGIAVFALLLCVGIWIFLKQRSSIFFGTSQRVGTVLLTALLFVFAVLFFIPVGWLSLARAPLIPLLIGGWIPLLALLAYYGRMSRVPLILLLFLVLEIATALGANHEARVLWASPDDSISRTRPDATGQRFIRPSLDRAIDHWKSINCPRGDCPRPILVAASGGASRAGFFTAATLGDLLDRSRNNPRLNDFRNQLFAISSVSGSSTGAAFFAAALRAANDDRSNPCRGPDRSGLVYFHDRPTSWRRCMEQLLAGDFISSTLFAYVFKDAAQGLAALGGFRILDRAAVLESSWERRFCQNAGPPGCDKAEFRGLEAPFLKVAAQTDQDRAKGKWFPLLFFNSTDADTGRRVVVSPVTSHTGSGARIFADAYDLHDLLADLPSTEKDRTLDEQAAQYEGGLDRDVSLSTAALLSARFPLISPPGVVFNRQDKVVARIIDGGYFENFGATTALELAQQLKQAGLAPFVIEITNDPELLIARRIEMPGTNANDPMLCDVEDVDPLCEEDPPINDTQTTYWLSDIRGPLSGLFGSRNAHGGQALRSLASFAGPGTAFCRSGDQVSGVAQPISFVHIVVHPQYRLGWWNKETCTRVELPLSWWLSKPVQTYLDHQIMENEPAIEEVIKVMEKRPDADALASPSR